MLVITEFNLGEKTLKYRYIVGSHTVGIITPSRKRHVATIEQVRAAGRGYAVHEQNGTPDGRVAAEEVIAYALKNRLT